MNKNIFTKEPNGDITWESKEGDEYVVTGREVYSKRNFDAMRFTSWHHARMINLWNGSVWLKRDGKRHLIRRVYN